MKQHISWEKTGSAEIVSLSIDAVTLLSTTPFPPGARITGSLQNDPTVIVKFKVHSSKKQDDGAFVIEGRPIDLSTATREKVMALMAP